MKKICKEEGCRNPPREGKRQCHVCRQRLYRERNSMMSSYHNKKSNAKKKGHEFDLTFEQFKEFCIKTEYLKGKGRKSESWHIDRIDETKGYTVDNIQVLTNRENVQKFARFKYRDRSGAHFDTVTIAQPDFSDVPF